MKITDIKPQKSVRIKPQRPSAGRDRFNIFLDGKFAFGVSSDILIKRNLTIGKNLKESEVREIIFEDKEEALFFKTLNFLSFRPRSEKEVRDYLRRKINNSKGLSEMGESLSKELIRLIISRLKRNDYINDGDFAVWWVEQRRKGSRIKGARLIKQELTAKGINTELIEESLSDLGKDELELAMKVLGKKFKFLKNKNPRVSMEISTSLKNRMHQYLLRRGFSWEITKTAVDDCIKQR